jgi:hypothetical protein
MVKRRTLSGIEKHPPQDELHLVDDNGDNGSENMMFSKALLSLSLKERNQIEEEIHGVSCMAIQAETPELIEKALREFQYELDFVIADAQKIAYNKAKENICSNSNNHSNSNSYLLCNENKLRFLRCEFFNPVQGSVKICQLFRSIILYIYGDSALMRRPIQLLQDFNKQELLFLKSRTISIITL